MTWVHLLIVLAFVAVVALLAPRIKRTFGRSRRAGSSRRPSDYEGPGPSKKRQDH